MKNNYKKESPLLTLVSLGGGSNSLGYGSAEEKYWFGLFGKDGLSTTGFGGNNLNFITVDSSGNVYVVSTNWQTATRGVLFKFNKSGVLQWQKEFKPSAGGIFTKGLKVDSSGNIYVSGQATSSVPGSTMNGYNLALIKFDSSGSIQWMRFWGSSSDDYGGGITIDGSDDIIILGKSAGRTGSSSLRDPVFVKWNSSGVLQYQEAITTNYNSSPASGNPIASDSSGNFYVIFRDNWNGYKTAIYKFNSNPSYQYKKRIVNQSWINGNSVVLTPGGVACDESGNAYFVGKTDAGGITNGSFDFITGKLESNGNLTWARFLGHSVSEVDRSDGIAIDGSGNVYIIGTARGTYYIGANQYGQKDMIIAKYNNSGTLQWVRGLGGINVSSGNSQDVEYGTSIEVDSTDKNLYICGYSQNGSLGYEGSGGNDIFFAKLPVDGSLTGSYSTGISGNNTLYYYDALVSDGTSSYPANTIAWVDVNAMSYQFEDKNDGWATQNASGWSDNASVNVNGYTGTLNYTTVTME